MNTTHKQIVLMECDRCGNIYARAGDVDIRLAHPRNAPANLKQGTCPRHSKGD